jgi:hypothetical protein
MICIPAARLNLSSRIGYIKLVSTLIQFLKYPRQFSAIFILIGVGFSYWMIVLPLQQARVRATEVRLSSNLVTWI